MLKSLSIKNFRGLGDFHVPKLGQVNLVVGRNNSGKSSVLEAIRIYAGNANRSLLEEIALSHNERYRPFDLDQEEADSELPFQGFFSGRVFPSVDGVGIEIGDIFQEDEILKIDHVYLEEYEDISVDESGGTVSRTRRRPVSKKLVSQETEFPVRNALQITKKDRHSLLTLDSPGPRYRLQPGVDLPGTTPCSVVPTQFVSMNDLARDWDKIVLSDFEEVVRNALKNIASDVEGVAFVEDDEGYSPRREVRRIAKVRLSSLQRAVPINSLGDGLLRVLQLTLKIFPAKGGILLIDEFENGLHYSVQDEIWSLVFEQAKNLGIQVFATTHSWDCIRSFASVAQERQDVDGILFRVGRSVLESNRGQAIATVFDEKQLHNITQSDLEVR